MGICGGPAGSQQGCLNTQDLCVYREVTSLSVIVSVIQSGHETQNTVELVNPAILTGIIYILRVVSTPASLKKKCSLCLRLLSGHYKLLSSC